MKFGFVDEHRHIWPVRVMCAVLGLSVSGYYAWRSQVESPRAAANRVLLDDIRRIHGESSGTYGSPRVHAVLRRRGRRNWSLPDRAADASGGVTRSGGPAATDANNR